MAVCVCVFVCTGKIWVNILDAAARKNINLFLMLLFLLCITVQNAWENEMEDAKGVRNTTPAVMYSLLLMMVIFGFFGWFMWCGYRWGNHNFWWKTQSFGENYLFVGLIWLMCCMAHNLQNPIYMWNNTSANNKIVKFSLLVNLCITEHKQYTYLLCHFKICYAH